MIISELEKYITKNSNTNSILNSLSIKPKYVGKGAKTLHFTCKGSTGNDYLISLECNSESVYNSKCNCPYDHGGLCKHIIAAVNFLKKSLKERTNNNIFENFPSENSLNNDTTDFLKPNEIPLENGILNWEKIEKLVKVNYYYENYQIVSSSQYQIDTKNDEWRSFGQILKYDPSSNILATYCSCSKNVKICEHIVKAINKVIFRDKKS